MPIHNAIKREKIGQIYERNDFSNYLESKGLTVLVANKKDTLHKFSVREHWYTGAIENRTIFVEVDENNRIKKVSIYYKNINDKIGADRELYLGLIVLVSIIALIGFFLLKYFL